MYLFMLKPTVTAGGDVYPSLVMMLQASETSKAEFLNLDVSAWPPEFYMPDVSITRAILPSWISWQSIWTRVR